MAASPLTIVGGILLLLAPGFFLLHALFPGRRYFGPFHPVAMPVLSVVTSAAVVIAVGTLLGFLPGGLGGKGWFQGSQSGAPVLEIVLGAISAILFAAGWARGAFPLLTPHRRAQYAGFQERGEPEEVTLLRDLRLEEERLRKEIARVRKRARDSRDVGVRTALTEAADDLEKDRAEVAQRAADLERRAGERRYGKTGEKPRFTARQK